MKESSAYEAVIGLEVHAQLLTRSKLFCSDAAEFGADANTMVSPITLAHPGTLPYLNRKAIELAVRLGLACNCEIVRENYFSRKNYFYPDLPRGYQVTQHNTPVCRNGEISIRTSSGEKRIRINRIHLEEDAGKSMHDLYPDNTVLDFNRAGSSLVEIVTEPDIRTAEEAYIFLSEIRKLLRWIDVSDADMEKGNLRCDANVSLRKKNETGLGIKTEIKNLNSIRNVKRALEIEIERMTNDLTAGRKIIQQTMSYDSNTGVNFVTREKEDADDYRYFPEPDLPPFTISAGEIENIRQGMPSLPAERFIDYTCGYGLSDYDASILSEERSFSEYFDAMLNEPGLNAKAAANWMLGPVKSWLNENAKAIHDFPVNSKTLAELINLVETGKLSFTIASGKIFSELLKQPGLSAAKLADELDLLQVSDTVFLNRLADEVLEKFAGKVDQYKKGKRGLLSLFVGELMKRSKGKADPKLANEILLKKLSN